MKARDIVGRKVVAVRQTRVLKDTAGRSTYMHLDEIELEGDILLRFLVHEGESEYGIEGLVVRFGR